MKYILFLIFVLSLVGCQKNNDVQPVVKKPVLHHVEYMMSGYTSTFAYLDSSGERQTISFTKPNDDVFRYSFYKATGIAQITYIKGGGNTYQPSMGIAIDGKILGTPMNYSHWNWSGETDSVTLSYNF